MVFQRCSGIFIGDRLTDNAVEPDDYRFLRFRPPADQDWRHIRLDRAAQFLIGDRLT